MLILSEYDIQFYMPFRTSMVAVLHLHPSLETRLRSGNELLVEELVSSDPTDNVIVPFTEYVDVFGNRCARFTAPRGHLRLSGNNIVDAEPNPDPIHADAKQARVEDLPDEVLHLLLPSRYCEVDRFGGIAQDLFGSTPEGWARAVAIRDWVHAKVHFNYNAARPTKTAMDVYTERIGVCRDFQHLALTLTRCMNIPARYVTGYIGDIRRPFSGPGDFSAWYQVFLDGRWMDLDARHNYPRLGRILMATGRDAADVAITTSFGAAHLTSFYVGSNEVDDSGARVTRSEASAEQSQHMEESTPTQSNASDFSPTQVQAATS